MKGNGFRLQRAHFIALTVLVLAGTAFFVGTSDSAAMPANTFPTAKQIPPECELIGEHLIRIDGQGEFLVESDELIAASTEGKQIDRNGVSTLPIQILGMVGRGHADGIGETVWWMDKTRPVEGSGMRAKVRGSDFPAVHDMRFHLFLTTEALPGKTFRSMEPAVMVNNNALSFPPRLRSRYTLKQIVEFEDVADPGIVVVRIVRNNSQIVRSGGRFAPVQQTTPRVEG